MVYCLVFINLIYTKGHIFVQITKIFKELEQATFALEPTEKEIGRDLITLLQ